jgi:prepilin-type N-terminal cleavage/methylation domain-containing protein
MPVFTRPNHGFTKTELVVCLVVIAILSALAVSAVLTARASARRTQCTYNLKTLGIALSEYHVASRAFPYGCVGNLELPPSKRWSWYPCIGCYTGHYGTPIIDLEQPWDAEELRPLMLHTWSNGMPPESGPYTDMGGYYVYDMPLHPFDGIRCPNAPHEAHTDGQPFASYIGMAGLGTDAPSIPLDRTHAGIWGYERQTRHRDITDGSSNTLLLLETARQNGCWLAGGTATVRGADTGSDLPYIAGRRGMGQFGGYHRNGVVAVFADGRVDFLMSSTDVNVFKAFCTVSENTAGSESR